MRLFRSSAEPRAARRLLTAAIGTAVLVTLLGALVQPIGAVPRTLGAHAAIETAVSLIGCLACFLLFARFRASCALSDLLLLAGILVLVLSNVLFGVAFAVVEGLPTESETWGHVAGRLLSVTVLAVAAFSPALRLKSPGGTSALVFAGCAGAVGAIGVAVDLLSPALPTPVTGGDPAEVAAHPTLLVMNLLATVVFAVAALGLALRAIRTADELLAWISAAAVLAAFAYLNYAIFPTLYSSWVHVGDVLRAAFYIALLIGAVREIDLYRRKARVGAQLEERQRMARDIHDGLAQDLAFLAGRLRDLTQAAWGRGDDVATLEMLSELAQRAFDEARAAIASFAGTNQAPLGEAVTRTAEEIASRHGGRASVRVELGLRVSDDVKAALIPIVREAVSNACRHGTGQSRRAGDSNRIRSEPVTVEVDLFASDGLQLTIKDDGGGFVKERPGGLGLRSMRERTDELGGELSITSTSEGTVVTVHLPPQALDRSAATVASDVEPYVAAPES